MAHPFEITDQVTVNATPEQIWAAITSADQIDSWFMGHTTVEPRPGGVVRTVTDHFAMESTVVAWEPSTRLRYDSATGPDGRAMAFEYVIDGRAGQSIIRFVHSGFLGDDWEAEHDALQQGNPMYLRKLVAYLTYFAGRTATRNIMVLGPEVAERDRAWPVLLANLGLRAPVALSDRVRATLDGLPPIDGVVDYITRDFLGVRTGDALYRFMHDASFAGTLMVEVHDFAADPDPRATAESWQAWLAHAFARPVERVSARR
jgi:uncharacterized protein YndB with AHSA1/START domain